MKPDTSDRNRTPTSTALASASGPDGVVVAAVQMVHGHVVGSGVGVIGGVPVVVKDQLKSPAMALPAASLTPAAPPLTVAVYFVPVTSGESGVSVLVGVSPPACA